MQKDGSLQGFDTGSGQRSWSISLDDPPRQLPVADGQLLLFQSAGQNGKLISMIDPATGKDAQHRANLPAREPSRRGADR